MHQNLFTVDNSVKEMLIDSDSHDDSMHSKYQATAGTISYISWQLHHNLARKEKHIERNI